MSNRGLTVLSVTFVLSVLAVVNTADGWITVPEQDWGAFQSRKYEANVDRINAPPIVEYRRYQDYAGRYYWYCLSQGYGTQWYEDRDGVMFQDGCNRTGWCVWAYQQTLTSDSGQLDVTNPLEGHIEFRYGPLYVNDWRVWRIDCEIPDPPAYWARFVPINGLRRLKTIPLESTSSPNPVVASARYRIDVGGDWTPQIAPDDGSPAHPMAMFFLTAIYDESVFDVSVTGQYQYPFQTWTTLKSEDRSDAVYWCWWRPHWDFHLKHAEPLPFTATNLRWYAWPLGLFDRYWQIPEYVLVRLKPGRTLDEVKGRTVRMMLHTVNLAEWKIWYYPNDVLTLSRTSVVEVGADGMVDDWRIEPPPLKDECVPRSFDAAAAQSNELDSIGAKVVNELNVEKPSMRVGHNRCRVGPSLSETYGNEACWEAFVTLSPDYYYGSWDIYSEPTEMDASFVRVNVHGVWFAIDDVPGWGAYFDGVANGTENDLRLNVYDVFSGLLYRYLADDDPSVSPNPWLEDVDYAFRTAKLKEVVRLEDPNAVVRTYEYANGVLVRQVDCDNNEITYGFANNELTVIGNGTRTIKAIFQQADSYGVRALVSASSGTGAAWRQYEWEPIYDQVDGFLDPRDGKLRAVKGAAGNYLAYLEYEDPYGEPPKPEGRLLAIRRGPAGMSVEALDYMARYEWTDPQQEAGQPYQLPSMDAKFYTDDIDDTKYELIRRKWEPLQRTVEQYLKVQPADGGNPSATTTVVYNYPPIPAEGEVPPVENFYYQSVPVGVDSPDGEFTAGNGLVSRCTTEILPTGQVARYTQYEYGAADDYRTRHVVQEFMAPVDSFDPTDAAAAPSEAGRRDWTYYENVYFKNDGGQGVYAMPAGMKDRWGLWQVDRQASVSRVGRAPAALLETDYTDFIYDDEGGGQGFGFLVGRREPQVATVTGESFRPERRRIFNPDDHREVSQESASGSVGDVVTTTTFDDYGYPATKTETAGSTTRSWSYDYNVFGELELETDPGGYVHRRRYYEATGLLKSTCTYAAAGDTEGDVIGQTCYEYDPTSGLLTKMRMAADDAPFAEDAPGRWIDTIYAYDDYDRLMTKTVHDPVSGPDMVTTFEYDRQDRLRKMTYPDGRSKTIFRDGRGQISRIEYWGTDGGVLASEYQYDLNGNLIVRTTEGCPECGPRTEYQYDIYNRRTAETRVEVGQ